MSLISPHGAKSFSRSLRLTNLDICETTTSLSESLASVRSFLRLGSEMATERTRSGSSSLPSSSREAFADDCSIEIAVHDQLLTSAGESSRRAHRRKKLDVNEAPRALELLGRPARLVDRAVRLKETADVGVVCCLGEVGDVESRLPGDRDLNLGAANDLFVLRERGRDRVPLEELDGADREAVRAGRDLDLADLPAL